MIGRPWGLGTEPELTQQFHLPPLQRAHSKKWGVVSVMSVLCVRAFATALAQVHAVFVIVCLSLSL